MKTRTEELIEFIRRTGGVATAAQIKAAGFLPGLIDYAYKQGFIDRLTRGVYCSADVLDDDFVAVGARWKKCVFSHGSALYLLGLSDQIPFRLDVTVPRGYNPASLKREYPGIRVHQVIGEFYALGREVVRTPAGGTVQAYGAERSVADVIKARRKGEADSQLVRDTVAGYFRLPGNDLPKLSRMCAALGVSDDFQMYLEVLS